MEMEQSRIATALVALAGLWLIAAPFVLGYYVVDGARSDDILFGVAITLVAGYRFFRTPHATWMMVVTAIMGLWVFLSPFYIGYNEFGTAARTDNITGIVVIALSAWAALTTRSHRTA